MALSNKFGWLVLTTGNKSEMSVGYATLYGDMAGGFAVIKDVPKTLVYELVRDRNEREGERAGPVSVLERPPSAELRPDQLDEDSLPPYDVLDRILEGYVERDEGREEPDRRRASTADVVDEVIRMVDRAEYKRRQAPPGHPHLQQGLRPRPPPADHQPLHRAADPARARSLAGVQGRCRQPGSQSRGPDCDRHPHQGAEAALVVEDLDVPDPGRAAACAAAGDGVDVALGDRAQKGGVVRLAHGAPSPRGRRCAPVAAEQTLSASVA